jgi:hypothetical protein
MSTNCSCSSTSSTISGDATTSANLIGKLYAPTYVSAYSIAVQNGFIGTEEEWLESLKGESAYQIAVDHGYEGTEEEWIAKVAANQILLDDIQSKVDAVSQTLNEYGTKLDPIFEAQKQATEESGDSVQYNLVIAEKEPESDSGTVISMKLTAQEITDICI